VGALCPTLLLVGGLEHFLFFHILGIIIPTDYSNFSEGLKPPTRLGGIKEGIGRISRYLNTPPQYRS
jgi:hypothetical protein